jgi:cell division protein ZapA
LTKTIEVEIYGQPFSITGAAEDAYVHKLAEMVDKQMKQVAQGMKTATPHKLAVLAALNIAHELRECEKKIQQMEADMERRMLVLMESIDEQVPSNTTIR